MPREALTAEVSKAPKGYLTAATTVDEHRRNSRPDGAAHSSQVCSLHDPRVSVGARPLLVKQDGRDATLDEVMTRPLTVPKSKGCSNLVPAGRGRRGGGLPLSRRLTG